MNASSVVRRLLLVGGLSLGALAPAVVGVGPVAHAAPLFVRFDFIEVRGTSATVFVTGTAPMTISHTVRRVDGAGGTPVPPTRIPIRDVAIPIGGGVLSDGGAQPAPTYKTQYRLDLARLQSSATYELTVNAATATGERTTVSQRFSTLKQRVGVTLDKIVVHDDGDWIGKGEPTWLWKVDWVRGFVDDCYPHSAGRCLRASLNEGTIYPYAGPGQKYSYVLAEENFQPVFNPNQQPGDEDFTSMPQNFEIHAFASESDAIPLFVDFNGASKVGWQTPQGTEAAEQQVTVRARQDGFDSTMYFTFRLFFDSKSYPANDGRVHAVWK